MERTPSGGHALKQPHAASQTPTNLIGGGEVEACLWHTQEHGVPIQLGRTKARETMSTNWKIKHSKQKAASLQWDGGNRLTGKQSEPFSVYTSSDTEGPLVVRVCLEKGSFYKIGFIFQTNSTDKQNPTKESEAVHKVLNKLYV